jgi:hypothetical protein
MKHTVEIVAVLAGGKVYHDYIVVKCADRNKAIGKARRMVELWKGSHNIVEILGFFADDMENRESNLTTARMMLRKHEALILASQVART